MKEVSYEDGASKEEPSSLDMAKKYKERDLSQTHFFRIAARTFGPPKSRRRIIVAPPMEKPPSEGTQVTLPSDVSQRRPFLALLCGMETPDEELGQLQGTDGVVSSDGIGDCRAWISQRKKFRAELENLGNVKKWLRSKPLLTELEEKILETMEAQHQAQQETALPPPEEDLTSPEPKSSRDRSITPSIQRPCPEAFSILDRYLQDNRLRLVDLYNRTDKTKKKKISSSDLKAVRKEANIPLNDGQLDDLVIFLGSEDADSINYKELAVGRRSWKQENPEWQHQLKKPKSEEGRPLTYEDMEEIGKMYRERRRTRKSRLKDLVDHCGVVKSGNAAIDKHSMPSTLGPEHGDMVNHFRREVLLEYMDILQLCHKYDIPLSEELLEQALLYPGDKQLLDSEQLLRLKQPGTSLLPSANLRPHLYAGGRTSHLPRGTETSHLRPATGTSSPGTQTSHLRPATWTSPPVTQTFHLRPATGTSSPVTQTSHLRPATWTSPPGTQTSHLRPATGISPKTHGKSRLSALPSGEGPSVSSSDAFKKQSFDVLGGGKSRLHMSRKPDYQDTEFSSSYPTRKHARKVKSLVRGKYHSDHNSTLKCWTTFEEYQEMTKNLKRKFPHLCSAPHVNAFWPGHLLDKLRIYIPHLTPTPGDALFSHIKPKRESYPGIYNNTHTWPVSDQGYVIYGDTDNKNYIL
ncbi:EF-hand calcium-binding domain-containing protein 12 [Lissotriton helveticus]